MENCFVRLFFIKLSATLKKQILLIEHQTFYAGSLRGNYAFKINILFWVICNLFGLPRIGCNLRVGDPRPLNRMWFAL